jgi:sortase A
MKMKSSKLVRRTERLALILGITFCMVFVLAHLHRAIMLRAEVSRFEESKVKAADPADATQAAKSAKARGIGTHISGAQRGEYPLWSSQRIQAYVKSLAGEVEPPLAMLRIPKIQLEVPVLDGADKLTLNRGVGWIAGTALPGEPGNIGIAGHRDGFFRGLKDVLAGDTIELSTEHTTAVYRVQRVRITSPDDTNVLRPGSEPSLTLVTCYPFYFVGPAPKRYIVQATLRR